MKSKLTTCINVKTWRAVSPHSIRPGTLFSFSTFPGAEKPEQHTPVYLCTGRPSKTNRGRVVAQRLTSDGGSAIFDVGGNDQFNTKFFRVEEIS